MLFEMDRQNNQVSHTSDRLPRWRALAQVMLPNEFSAASINRTERCSTYAFFAEVLSSVRRAHSVDDSNELPKIYAFAEWSLWHPNKQLWNAAGVSFYEHAFDHPADIDNIMAWIAPKTRAAASGLWDVRLEPATLERVKRASQSVHWTHQRECDVALQTAIATLNATVTAA